MTRPAPPPPFLAGTLRVGVAFSESAITAAAMRARRGQLRLVDALLLDRADSAADPPPSAPPTPTAAAPPTQGPGADPGARTPTSPAEPTDHDIQRLARALERRALHHADIHLAAPRALLMHGVVEAPPRRSDAPRGQIARAQMARMFHVEPPAFELALWELPETPNRDAATSLLACGCAHELGHRLADRFARAGLYLASLAPGELSAAALLADAHDPALVAVVQVGEEMTHIALLTGGRFLYERTVDGAGGRAVVRALSAGLGVQGESAERIARGRSRVRAPGVERAVHPLADAIAREVGGAFDFAQHRWPGLQVGDVRLTGPYAAAPGLAETVELRTGAPTRAPDASARFAETAGSGVRSRAADGSMAAALAVAAGVLRGDGEVAA